MSLNLRIARIHGIDLYIHWTFWLLPLWVIATWTGHEMFPLWMHLLLIASLFVCVVLHEFGHALTAQRFGIGTRNITLSPLGGIAQLERMSQKPIEEFTIAIAGPLVNVAIAVLLSIPLLASALVTPTVMNTAIWEFFGILLVLNVVMVVFNMIPAFPMDGGRVLRAMLSSSMGHLRGTRVAVLVGTVLAFAFGFLGVFVLGNPWLLFIALFVILAGHQELMALEVEERQRHAEEEETILGPHTPHVPMVMTYVVWDPVRRQWVHHTHGDGV